MPKASGKTKRTAQKDGRMVAAGNDTQIYTRIPNEYAEKLRAAAAADDRYVMTYLRRLIVSHLDTLDKENNK
jgi:hypothetical protein